MTPQGQRLAERTAALASNDQANGWAHAILCEGIQRMIVRVAEVYDPPGDIPPGAPLLDPALCPDWALPWLAMVVGVTLPSGADPETQRTIITSVAGWQRGTPAALRAAAQLTLTGTKTVYFRERDGGNAYRLEVVTLIGETPDQAALLRVVTAQKPGGIVLSLRQVVTWDWQEVTTEVATWALLKQDYATWQDVLEKHPTS